MICKGYAAKIPFSSWEAQELGLEAEPFENGKLAIYVEGRGAETLEQCLAAFRKEPGELWVYGGYRVLGGSREKIMAIIRDLKRRKIIVVDKMNKERSDQHDSEMLDRALRQILGANKVRGSRMFARKIAARGGKAKGESMERKRQEIADEAVIRNVVNCPLLTWEWKVKIFDGKISEATMRRRYYGESRGGVL